MPVTPFHFGPGVLAKALLPASVSLTVFALVQVVIDLESAYYLFVVRQWPVHRWAHTFLWATVIGLAVGAAIAAAARYFSPTTSPGQGWWWSDLGVRQCLVGGLLGGASHPLLDGIMHWDIQPLRPWSTANPLLGLVGVGALHLFCIVAGVSGLILWMLRSLRNSPGTTP
jgi:hypothetical protein